MKKTSVSSTILSLAFGAVIASASSSAEAAQGVKSNCTVTQLAYDSHLFVQCASDSTNYYAYTQTEKAGCSSPTNVNVDTLKIWHSMFTAALLSGRSVDIYYVTSAPGGTSCGTIPYIYNVGLK